MRVLRTALGLLVWVVALLLTIVGVVLCVTVLLIPVGVPLLMLCRRLFGAGLRLITSRKITHPVEELRRATAGTGSRGGS